MSGGPPPPFYGFNIGRANPPFPQPNYQYPSAPPTRFPSAPFPGAPSTDCPPPYPGLTTSNYYPSGETHFTSSFTPQSHNSFAPQSHTSFTPQSHTSFTSPSQTSFRPASISRWVPWSKGVPIPHSAVLGGRDCDGSTIYVGRVHHKSDLLPAKVLPMKNVAYCCYDGKEIAYNKCEILCQEGTKWILGLEGRIPIGAIPIGNTSDGETLYAARFHHKGSLTVGKLHPSHGSAYIPFDGKEVSNSSYEVLVG